MIAPLVTKPVLILPPLILSHFLGTSLDILKRNCVIGFGSDISDSALLSVIVFSILAVGCMFIHPSFDYNI
jgi:hypothetical protein